MRKGYLLAIALVAGSLAVGCEAVGGDTPEKGAREFMESVFAGDIDKFKSRICAERSAALLKQGEEQIRQFKEVMKVQKFDLSGVRFSAEVSGDTAIVKATGKWKFEATVDGKTKTEEFELDRAGSVRMVREGGIWKYCDSL